MPTPLILSWSSGKDAAWALKVLRETPEVEVVALMTSYSSVDRRVPITFTRVELVQAQARLLKLPLILAPLPTPCSTTDYESAINTAVQEIATLVEVEGIAFADIKADGVRTYRERFFQRLNLNTYFPLWDRDTGELAREMIDGGSKAMVSAVDTQFLPAEMAGRPFDHAFLKDLPPKVDPCGEWGEFFTFCYGGPIFPRDLEITPGQSLVQGNFAYQDFRPVGKELGVDVHLEPRDTEHEPPLNSESLLLRPAVVRASSYNLESVKTDGGSGT